MTDWPDDPTAHAWVRDVLENMVPKMVDSALVVSIVPENREADVKYAVELGFSIMLGKPIVAVVLGDAPMPPKLELIADEIVRCPAGVDPSSSGELIAAIERVLGGQP